MNVIRIIARTICRVGVSSIAAIGIFGISGVMAQGIPVYDASAIYQAILQLQAWEAQYRQMESTIQQQQQQLQSITGARGLGTVMNAITGNVLPPNISLQIAGAQSHDALNALAATNFQTLSTALKTRASQIQSLMGQINATNDSKSIQELTARIQAEQVMATNEAKEAEWLRSQVDTQARQIDRARLNQRLYGQP
jgi:type IV secretion system protein VirB5